MLTFPTLFFISLLFSIPLASSAPPSLFHVLLTFHCFADQVNRLGFEVGGDPFPVICVPQRDAICDMVSLSLLSSVCLSVCLSLVYIYIYILLLSSHLSINSNAKTLTLSSSTTLHQFLHHLHPYPSHRHDLFSPGPIV